MVETKESSHEHHNCQRLLGSLSDYVDGELAETLCAELERHMADCEKCRIVVDTLRKTVYLYHSTAECEPVPSEVKERLLHCLDLDDLIGK